MVYFEEIKKKSVLTLLFVSCIALLFIGASCSSSSSKDGAQATGKSFRVGTEGLTMRFLSGSPPSQIYTGTDNLPIMLEVINKGAYPSISEQFTGDIYLSGFDSQILQISPVKTALSSQDLYGRSETYQQGGIQRISDFKINTVSLSGGEKSKQTILATVCYQYATLVEAPICVDPDPYGITIKDKVCQAKDVTLTSQGAPVVVTKIEQDMLKDRLQFTIHVKNMGSGRLLSTEGFNNCPDKIRYEDLNKVVISEASLGGRPLTCSPGGSITKPIYIMGDAKNAKNSEGVAVCTTTGSIDKDDSAYQSTLTLKLIYAYQDSAQTSIEVIKIPE
ncbi:MAG: hypothetical protein Q8O89_02145 [Nanoarchaeota archaeon]|nr:hypothetical protein [Nanoarchaeota archaeon]